MEKILLILSREYITRVKKKSFLIMTFAGPLLIALLYGITIWLVISDIDSEEVKKIMVVDESRLFHDKLTNEENTQFEFTDISLEQAKILFLNTNDYGLLYIPQIDINKPIGIKLHCETQPNIGILIRIEKIIQKEIERIKMEKEGIDNKLLEKIKTNIDIETVKLTDKGEETSNAGVAIGIGMISSLLIYLFIFMYGIQVMRGVIEEKTSRIVEVIVSTVRPFQLMMGKIVGVALVGLTQFLLWILLVALITSIINAVFLSDVTSLTQNMGDVSMNTHQGGSNTNSAVNILEALKNFNFVEIIACFIFYFIGGYLLYSSLFAAIGSAVDSEADTQQFILPITIPLIFGFILAQNVIKNPDTSLAFWLSVIPLTSPVVMMVRLPFGVPVLEIILSMIMLILGFLLSTYIAGKIYRIGILMYGKKPTFKELGKWIFY